MRSYVIQEPPPMPGFPGLAIISLWFGVVLIVLTAVADVSTTLAWLNPFIDSMHLILAALLLGSFLTLSFQTEDRFQIAALPLVINLGVLIMVHLVPFGTVWQEMTFRMNLAQYNELIGMVEAGELAVNEQGAAFLPSGYEHLSADGIIMIQQEAEAIRIFFYQERLTHWHFSGYFYRSDANPPQQGDFGGRWQHIRAKRVHWFWCNSY